MSEYIASAKVKISPDTVGFEKALRTKLKPILEKPLGIPVVPVTKGFSGAIRKALKDAKPIPVAIVPTRLKAFSQAITDAAVAAKVSAVPDVNIAAFRAALQAQVDTAAAGVVATIPAVPVAGAAAGAGAAATAEATALKTAISDLTVQMQALVAAQAAASKGGKAAGTVSKGLTTQESLRAKVTENLAIAELALVDAQNLSLGVQERLDAATLAGTKIKTAYNAATTLQAQSATAENIALRQSVAAVRDKLAAEQTAITQVQELAAATARQATLQKRFNLLVKEAAAVTAVEVAGIKSANVATTQRTVASQLFTKFKRLETAAITANVGAIATESAAQMDALTTYISSAKLREKTIRDELRGQKKLAQERIRAGKTAAGQISFARRGAAATGLSLLGIRGATLASTGAFLAGAAAASVFALSVKSAVDLEQELNVFQETAGATADEMERVRVTAEALGRDIRLPGISAADAAVAMTSLAKAGLSVKDSIAGATGVLQLSIAANIDLARSTEIVASALNAFGLSGDEAIRVADVLANSANLAQGSIDDMGIAMQQAAAVGRQAGLSFEDTATFLTILARAGLRGSDAGTSLRTGLIRLINPTEKAQKILDKLGVSIRDAAGNVRPEVFQNLAAATAGMTKAQRDQTIAQLAGNDAVRAFSIIMRLTTPELIKFRQENRKLGSAAALTEARAKGLSGQARGLASNLQTVGIAVGRRATPALEGFVQGLNSAVLTMADSEQVSRVLNSSLQFLGDSWEATRSALEAVAPTALQAANALTNVALSIGLPELAAAAVAYRAIPALLLGVLGPAAALSRAFLAVRVALGALAFAMMFGGPVKALSLGFRAAASAALAFATSVQGVAIIAALAAAGIVYLLTRETALEKAQKNLKESTDALAQSLTAYKTATESAASAASSLQTERLAVGQAKLSEELARSALRNSQAGKRSIERRQLENALAIAVDNVRLAEERLGQAQLRSLDAQAELEVAGRNRRDARKAEMKELQDFITLSTRLITVSRGHAPFDPQEEALKLARATNEELGKRIRLLEEENTAGSRDLANRLRILRILQGQLGRVLQPQEMRLVLNSDDLESGLKQLAPILGKEGEKDAEAWIRGLLNTLPGAIPKISAFLKTDLGDAVRRQAKKTGDDFAIDFVNAIANGLKQAKKNLLATLDGMFAALKAEAESFAEKEDLLTIAMGGRVTPQAELALARREEANARKRLQAIRIKAGKGGGLTDELKADREKARADQAAALRKIADLEDQIAADAESARDEAESKAEEAADDLAKAGEAFIEKLGRKQTQPLLRRQARAELTPGLADDIKLNKALQKLYKRQINVIRENVKDKETRNAAIRELQAKSFQLDIDLKQLIQQQNQAREQVIRESLELDIEHFQTTENVRGEIRARRRFIAYLKKLQADTKAGTVEYKRLRNEIEQQQKAIEDLNKKQKERNNAWNTLTFEFMQAQQGFVSNLLGNLIPLGASQGLVGGTSPTVAGAEGSVATLGGSAAIPMGLRRAEGTMIDEPDRRLLRAQGRAAGVAQPPMGRDQASTEISILQTIANILARMERGARHPEARRAQVSQGASYDTMPHGASYVP